MTTVLTQMAIYLAAAVVAVPLSQRLGFGSVLGYLAAGMAIGPALGLIGSETGHIQEYAEYGVVLMLFLVGLEMRPRMLWELRHRLLGLGGLQVALTLALLAGVVRAIGPALEPGGGDRDHPVAVLDGDRDADARREEAGPHRGRAGELRGAALPGRGGDPAPRDPAAARARRGAAGGEAMQAPRCSSMSRPGRGRRWWWARGRWSSWRGAT